MSTHQVDEASISVLTTTETQWTGIDLSNLKAKYAASVQGIDYWLNEFELQLKTANERFIKIIEEKKIFFERLFSELKKKNIELENLVKENQINRDSKTDVVEKLQKQFFEFSSQLKEKTDAVEMAKEVLKKEKDKQVQIIKDLEAKQKEKMDQLDKLKKELYEISTKINGRQNENHLFQKKLDTQVSSLQDKEELLIHRQKKELQNISQEIRDVQDEYKERQKRQKIVEAKEKEFKRIRDNLQHEEETYKQSTDTIFSSWKSRNPPLTEKQKTITEEYHQLKKTVAHYTEQVEQLESKLRHRETTLLAEQEELQSRYSGVTETLNISVERFERILRNFEEIRKKRDQTKVRLGTVRDTVSPVRLILDNVRESVSQRSKKISEITEELKDKTLEKKNLENNIKDLENEKNQLRLYTQKTLQDMVPFRREKESLEFDIVELSSRYKKDQKDVTNQNGTLEKIQKQINSIKDQIPPPQAYETIRVSLQKLEEKSNFAENNFGVKKTALEEELRRITKENHTLKDDIEKKKIDFQKNQTLLQKKEHELQEINHKITILRGNIDQFQKNHQNALETNNEEITTITRKRENNETTLREIQSQQSHIRNQHRQYREQLETSARVLEKIRSDSKKIKTDREELRNRRVTADDTRVVNFRFKEVQTELGDIKNEILRREIKIREVLENQNTVNRDLEVYGEKVQELNSQIVNKTSQIEQIIHEILELAPRQKRKLEEAKKEIFILKASINKRTQQHNEAHLHLKEIDTQLLQLNSKLEDTLKELELYNIDKERERFSEVRGKLLIAKKEIEALRSDIEMRTSQYQEKIKLLDTSGGHLENLISEKNSLISHLDPLKSECMKLKEDQKNLFEEQRKTEIERTQISAELEKLRKEQSQLQTDLQQSEMKLKTETGKMEKLYSEFRTDQSELEKTKIDLDIAIDKLKTSDNHLRSLENQEKNSKQSLEQAKTALTTLRGDLDQTSGDLGNLRNSINSAEEKYSAMERNFENIDSERKKMKKEISELQSKKKTGLQEVAEGDIEKKKIDENARDFGIKFSIKKEEIRNIEKRILDLEKEIEKYKELLETTNQQKSYLANQIDSIDFQDLFQEFSDACEELEKWKNNYQKKCTDYDLLTTKSNNESPIHLDTVEQVNKLRKNISEKTSVEKDLKNSTNHLRSELQKNQSEWEFLKKELFSAESDVGVLTKRYEISRSKFEQNELEKNSLLSRISELTLKIETIKKEREIEASRAEALSAEASALGTQVDAQLERIEIFQSELQELENLRVEIESLSTTLSTLKTTHRLYQTAVQVSSTTSMETDQLTRTRSALISRVELLRNDMSLITSELKSLDQRVKDLREQRKTDRERIRNLERQERDLAVEREIHRQLVVDLETQLTELESFRGDFDASVIQRRVVKEEYVRIEKEVHLWDSKEVDFKKEENESTRQKLTQLSNEKKTLQIETQTTRNRIRTLEKRIESLKTERDSQNARLEALKADITAIKTESEVNLVWMETEHHRIQSSLFGLNRHLTDRYTDLMSLLSQHQIDVHLLKSQLRDIEIQRNQKKKKFDDLSTDNEKSQLELSNMRKKMGQLETTLEEYKIHVVKAEAKILELRRVLEKHNSKDQNSPEKEKDSPEKESDVHKTEKGVISGKRAHQEESMDVEEYSPKSGTPSVKKPRLRIGIPPSTPHLHTEVVPQNWANEGSDTSDRR